MEKRNRLVETDLQKVIKQVIRKEKHNNQLTLENRNLKGGYHKENLNEQVSSWISSLFSDDKEELEKASSEYGSDAIKDDVYSTVKQAFIGKVIETLGVSPDLAKFLRVPLSKIDPADYWKFLMRGKYCVWISDIVFESLLEYMVQKISDSFLNTGGILSIGMSKGFNTLTKNTSVRKELKNFVTESLCNYFDNPEEAAKFKTSVEDVVKKKVKRKYIPNPIK